MASQNDDGDSAKEIDGFHNTVTTKDPVGDDHWVTVWTAMPQLTEPENMPPPPFVSFDYVDVSPGRSLN